MYPSLRWLIDKNAKLAADICNLLMQHLKLMRGQELTWGKGPPAPACVRSYSLNVVHIQQQNFK